MHILIMVQFSASRSRVSLRYYFQKSFSSRESLQSKNILLKRVYKHSVMNNVKQTYGPNPVTQIETLRLSVGRLWHLLPVGLYLASSSTGIKYSPHFLRVLPITVQ